MNKITLIDCGLGNIKSVQRAFEILGSNIKVSSNANDVIQSEKLVLPGVGTFSDGMTGLKKNNLVEPIIKFVKSGKPILGICLGMQLMFEHGEEFGNHNGLGIIKGKVIAIPFKSKAKLIVRKVPHIGWNQLKINSQNNLNILNGIHPDDYFYFVHSYMGILSDNNDLLATCCYEGLDIVAGMRRENVIGLQFHPEKSGEKGLKIIQNFINLNS